MNDRKEQTIAEAVQAWELGLLRFLYDKGIIIEIKNIATVPEHQGKGYGRTLIDFLANLKLL